MAKVEKFTQWGEFGPDTDTPMVRVEMTKEEAGAVIVRLGDHVDMNDPVWLVRLFLDMREAITNG